MYVKNIDFCLFQCGIFSFPFYSQLLNIELRTFIKSVFVQYGIDFVSFVIWIFLIKMKHFCS
jgi:hypothetical protein